MLCIDEVRIARVIYPSRLSEYTTFDLVCPGNAEDVLKVLRYFRPGLAIAEFSKLFHGFTSMRNKFPVPTLIEFLQRLVEIDYGFVKVEAIRRADRGFCKNAGALRYVLCGSQTSTLAHNIKFFIQLFRILI
jgi:hypothetical protein